MKKIKKSEQAGSDKIFDIFYNKEVVLVGAQRPDGKEPISYQGYLVDHDTDYWLLGTPYQTISFAVRKESIDAIIDIANQIEKSIYDQQMDQAMEQRRKTSVQ
jgi:hypothetical protein